MAEFFKNITSFVNNQKANFNNAVSSFRSDYFDNLEDQIEALEVKKTNNTISANEQSKLNSLIEQRDSLNESVEYNGKVKHRLGIYFFKVKDSIIKSNSSRIFCLSFFSFMTSFNFVLISIKL